MKQKGNRLNISESELLEYIQGQINPAEIRPAGFGITAGEYRVNFNPPLAFSTARRQLNGLVESGKLKSKQMTERGHLVTVFYK
jgi:hypothetical protein